MDNQRIIDRVKKLLAMTGEHGATDGEVQVAMNKAHSLMAEYHLSVEDLGHEPADDYEKIKNAEKGHSKSFAGTSLFGWEQYLAMFVSKFVGVPVYKTSEQEIARKNGIAILKNGKPYLAKCFVFYGLAEDAAIASSLYDELRSLISTMAFAKWGTVYKGDGGVYAEGFVSGLNTKLEESIKLEKKEATTSTAMVLISRRDDLIKYKVDIAKTYLQNSLGIKKLSKSYGTSGAKGSKSARQEGYIDGKNTDVIASRMKKLS